MCANENKITIIDKGFTGSSGGGGGRDKGNAVDTGIKVKVPKFVT